MGKILITGGSGFIGGNLVLFLKRKGYDVEAPCSAVLNVLEKRDWEKWKECNIDHVVHLAGKTFVPDSWEEPEQFYNVNIDGTLRAIEFCRKYNAKMTYISAYVYGVPRENPISEETSVNPNNPYADSKYLAEELCRKYCELFDMNITILRLFNVYGNGQKDDFLIPIIIKQVLGEGEEIQVLDLEPKRDYVHVDDVCRAIELSIKRTSGYHLFNIGSGESHSVKDVISIIQRINHSNKTVVSKNKIRKNELNDVVANVSYIRKEWDWVPQIGLEDGLKKCLE